MRTREQHMNPKDQWGRPPNIQPPIRRTIEKPKQGNPPTTPTRMNRTRTHWRKATKGYLVDQLGKHGWKGSKTTRTKYKTTKELGQIMIDLLRM